MADYRQDCATPGCGYTGFTPHSSTCNAIWAARDKEDQKVKDAENQKVKDAENQKWTDYFDSLSDESIFKYIGLCDREIARTQRYVKRRNKALEYLRNKGKAGDYLDWKRNG